MRKEKDFLGEMELPPEALYGIHSARARSNFPNSEPFSIEWYMALGSVKLSCYNTVLRYRKELEGEHPGMVDHLRIPDYKILEKLAEAATEMARGDHYDHFIVPAIQGGAGTSINMNINEIIANRAMQLMDKSPGSYDIIDPLEAANIYQSTNDVIPSSLTVTIMALLNKLEASINQTRQQTEKLEHKYRHTLRLGFTQLQQAVPATYGQLFSNYSDALSRDWWRISKTFERIKQINLGGGAIGTGLSIPRYYIMEVVGELRKLTGLPLAQGENLTDITSNMDSYVEVHAILKAHAVGLEKMANDLRLLSSDIIYEKEMQIPALQAGSTIMPGKVNPVISEYVVSGVHEVYSHDQLITSLAGQGQLDLNAYVPSIGHAMIKSLKMLISLNESVSQKLLHGIKIDEEKAARRLFKSPAVTTALSPLIGYHEAGKIAALMKEKSCDVFEANRELGIIQGEHLNEIMKPEFLLKKGFTIKDIRNFNKSDK